MQVNTVLLLALASPILAQSSPAEASEIPFCALICLTTAFASVGCGLMDTVCQCGSNKDAISASATPCILKACSTQDAMKTQQITSDICASEASSSASSSAAPSSSPEAPASAPESVSASASATSAAAGGVETNTSHNCSTNAASSTQSSASGIAATGTSSLPSSTTTSSLTEQFSGAAGKAQAGMGMMMGVAIAAIAL